MSAEYVTETLSANLSDRLAECRAEVAKLRERLRLTAQILVEEIGASGPANADDLARIAAAEVAKLRAENDRYRAEVDRLTVANANYEINISAMWADYKGAVADRERYRAALVEISALDTHPHYFRSYNERFMCAKGLASNALANRSESGQLSDDSGPIASDSK